MLKHGLLVATLVVAACGRPEPQEPVGVSHEPQQPVTNPRPQQPLESPTPQSAVLGQPQVQRPINDPEPQKPLMGDNASDTKAKQVATLNDGQILKVVMVANDGEIDLANLAKKNASAKEVKDFAALMISQHGEAQRKARVLESKSKIKTEVSDTSTHVANAGADAAAELRNKTGAEFDRGYMSTMVRAHQDVLDTIDTTLVPQSHDADLKAYLSDVRRHVAMHLDKAKDIQKTIEPRTSLR